MKFFHQKLLFSGSIFTFCLLNIFGQGTLPGHWITREPLPTARQEMALAVLNGKIYVSGGILATRGTSNAVEVFDPVTNSWETTAPMPQQLHHHGVVAHGGKIYVLGGYNQSFTSQNYVFEYDPVTNQWDTKTPVPTPIAAHVAVSFEDKIYLIGGVGASTIINNVHIYDPVNDSWTEGSPMPTYREHLAGSVIDSLIYIVAGRQGNTGAIPTLEAYSPKSDRWYPLKDIPVARGGLAATVHHNRLLVLGGEIFQGNGQGIFHQNHVYHAATDTWTEMASMPTPRHGMGAVAVGDTIYVIGGATQAGFGATDENEGFVFTKDLAPVKHRIDFTVKNKTAFILNSETLSAIKNNQGENFYLLNVQGKIIQVNKGLKPYFGFSIIIEN